MQSCEQTDLMRTNETREPATVFSCNGNSNLLEDEVPLEAVVSGYTMRVGTAARQAEVSNIRPVSGLKHLMRGTTTARVSAESTEFPVCCENVQLCMSFITHYVMPMDGVIAIQTALCPDRFILGKHSQILGTQWPG